MKTFIGMVAFVLEQDKLEFIVTTNGYAEDWSNFCLQRLDRIIAYANFLSRQPQLSDFVACGEDWLPLVEPKDYQSFLSVDFELIANQESLKECIAYQQALDKVLFKGFWLRCPNAVTNGNISITFTKSGGILLDKYYQDHTENISTIKTLESLTPYNLELTENAKNTINGNV